MKRPSYSTCKSETHVVVPADALDELLECVWEWAFVDFVVMPATDRDGHLFHSIVRLDSALRGISVDESWERINTWWNEEA